MKNWYLALAAATSLSLSAADVTVTIEPLFSVSGGAFAGLTDVRAQVISTLPGAGAVSHIVTGPLQPPPGGDGSMIGGDYEGIDATTGEVLETGIIAFDLGTAPTTGEGEVVSPIIGVIPRAGTWEASGVTIGQPSTALGNASGTSSFESGTITFNLASGSVTGTANAHIQDDMLVVDAFSLTSGGTTYSFGETDLDLQSDGSYTGVIVSTQSTVSIDEVAYVMTVSGLDGDWYAPYTMGQDDLVQSETYGNFWFLPADTRWIWHQKHGYQFVNPLQSPWVQIWDMALASHFGQNNGWLVWNANMATKQGKRVFFYSYTLSGGTYVYFEPDSGGYHTTRWFYVYSGPLHSTGYQGSGWHEVPGAQ